MSVLLSVRSVFQEPLLYVLSPCAFGVMPTNDRPRPQHMPQRRVPSSQALLGPPAPHVDCKYGPCDEDAQRHADEEDGFRWGRKHHFVEQCGVLGSASPTTMMLEIYEQAAPHLTDPSGALRIRL